MKNNKIILISILLVLSWCTSLDKETIIPEVKEKVELNSAEEDIKDAIEDIKDESIKWDEKNIKWGSMEPLIKNGAKVLFNSGYYDTKENIAVAWDIISYDFKWEKEPIIKKIVANDNDNIEIKDNTLFVNWIEVKNSIWESYNFSEWEQKMMGMYIKDWKIPKDSLFILWDNTHNSIDSRRFWAISTRDVFWKIKLKK